MIASVSVLADRRRPRLDAGGDAPNTEWLRSPSELVNVDAGCWVVIHPRGHRYAIHGLIGTMHPSTAVSGDVFFLLGTHRGIECYRLSQILRARRADPPGVGDCVVKVGVPEDRWRGAVLAITSDDRAFCYVTGNRRETVERGQLRVAMLAD